MLQSGTILHGTYKIEKILGQGSFGITYLAEHTNLGKKVAIKEFFMKELNSRGEDDSITGMSDSSLSQNYCQKFKKEAINLSRLDHPNIVRVTDSFSENGTFYYVMDFIEGQNLNDYIKSHYIDEAEAVSIIKSVADALIYMHEEKHMLHLDLKPGNVMRRNDGHIFLIDFGLSKHYSTDGQPETSTTIGLGTAGYAPIEQGNKAKNGEFRPTIDVYALGATFYKLLTRETPPPASDLVSDDELLENKLREKGVSDNLIEVVTEAMCPNVRKRIPTVRVFMESLPSVENAIASTYNKVTEKSKETECINHSDSGEETVFTGSATEKHPDFDESKYVIKSDYKNFPVVTSGKANNGDKEAMLALGMMALRGEVVGQDFDTAYTWFKKLKDLGDDRGEKMLHAFSSLKTKYKSESKTQMQSNPNKNDTNKPSESGNDVFLFLGIIVTICLIVFSVKGCQKKQAEAEAAAAAAAAAAEKARIESIARNTNDWYGAGNGGFYCMVEGKKHYVNTYGIPDGQRTVHYTSGDTFVGTVKNGSKSKGKYTDKNGDYFEGTFWNGLKDTGYGKETSYDGKWVYEGNYKNGMRNGSGIERWPKEKRKNWTCMLECTYKDNQRHGIGTWYYNDYTYLKCKFKNGKEVATLEEGIWKW